jgi:hypothetical protein
MAELDPQGCADRLSAWQRADRYTSGGTLHVPALAEGKPVRQDSDRRRAPLTPRRAGQSRPDQPGKRPDHAFAWKRQGAVAPSFAGERGGYSSIISRYASGSSVSISSTQNIGVKPGFAGNDFRHGFARFALRPQFEQARLRSGGFERALWRRSRKAFGPITMTDSNEDGAGFFRAALFDRRHAAISKHTTDQRRDEQSALSLTTHRSR